MKQLRILQGGVEGDKEWLEELAANGGHFDGWVAPKDSHPGDDVVVYIAGYGFFATGLVQSHATPRKDWPNRYGVTIGKVKLIDPAISLGAIRRHIPKLTWAIYPRSINTPDARISVQIRELIRKRRKTRLPDLDDDALIESNIDELRRVAIMRSARAVPARRKKAIYRARSQAIKLYVLRRADGACESCFEAAPFVKPDGSPYLEPHHTTRLADDGPDHPLNVIALCPNCHRRAHHAEDAKSFNGELRELLRDMEPR